MLRAEIVNHIIFVLPVKKAVKVVEIPNKFKIKSARILIFDMLFLKASFMNVIKCICPTLLFVLLMSQVACNNQHEYEIKSLDNYEKGKESLADMEQKNPLKFLTVKGDKKKNLFGQTVVRGSIYNNAKMVSYKDVDVKLSFYSKTGTLLEEDHNVVYETITPGNNKSFKSRFFAPKGTDSVGFKIVGAKH